MVNLVDVPGYALPASASRRDPLVGRDELGREIRMARNGVRYLATDIAPVVSGGAGGRGAVYNLLDNIIGYDDDVVTPGERLKSGVQSFVGGLLSDPLGTGADIVRGGYETVEGAMDPRATPMGVLGAAGMTMGAGGLAARPAGSVGVGGRVYHGGMEKITSPEIRPDPEGLLPGFSVARTPEVAEMYARLRGGDAVSEFEIDPQRLNAIGEMDYYNVVAELENRLGVDEGGLTDNLILEELQNRGVNAISYPDEDFGIRVLDPSVLQPVFANRSTPAQQIARPAGSVGVGEHTPAQQIARLLREGRASEVTDDLYAAADPQELHRLYETGATGADMPMDTASRMARAEEAGFDARAYHGTAADFTGFDADKGVGARQGTGVFSSNSPKIAETYAPYNGGRVLPIMRRADTPIVSADGAAWNRLESPVYALDTKNWDDIELIDEMGEASTNDIARAGRGVVDALSIEDVSDIGPRRYGFDSYPTYGTINIDYDPSNIRSRFARFDPRLSHLRNLSAANVDPTLGLLAAQAGTEQDPLTNLRNYVAQHGLLAQ